MNAEQVKNTLNDFQEAARKMREAWSNMEQHRLEMEAEEKQDDLETPEEVNAHLACHDNTNFDHSGRLDAIEKRLDTLYKSHDRQHEKILKNRRRLDEIEPSLPVTVKMRQHTDDMKTGRWECRLGGWWVSNMVSHPTTAAVQSLGNTWLATVGKQLNIRFLPEWDCDAGYSPTTGKVEAGSRCAHCGVILTSEDLPASCTACDKLHHV